MHEDRQEIFKIMALVIGNQLEANRGAPYAASFRSAPLAAARYMSLSSRSRAAIRV